MNLAAAIDRHPDDAVALIDGDRSVTYGELRAEAAAVRAGLAAAGVGPGDTVAILADNEIAFVTGAFGVLGRGATVIPVNPRAPILETTRKLQLLEPTAVIFGEGGAASMGELADVAACHLIADLASQADQRGPAGVRIEPIEAGDVAFHMLTSGVSGQPKAAVLTHQALGWAQQQLCEGPESFTAADVVLGCLPFTHIFGLNAVLLATLRAGGTVVLQRRFDMSESLDLIKAHRVTRVAGAPLMWRRWAEADVADDTMASVTYAASGAVALPREVFDAVKAKYGIEIREGYGLTETCSIVSASRGIPVKATSVGKPLDGIEVLLVEEDGTPADPGDTGEIVVRGPNVFSGYLNDPDATDMALTDDGWFWTGDVGVFDDDGYLYLVDRIKDVIIVSGFNVYPSEVESAINEHPGVLGSVVGARPDREAGERIVAHVRGSVSEAELRSFVAERLSSYKRPAEYVFVEELPISPVGKKIRRKVG